MESINFKKIANNLPIRILISIIAVSVFYLFSIKGRINNPFVVGLFVTVALFCYQILRDNNYKFTSLPWMIFLGLFVIVLYRFFIHLKLSYYQHTEWDFTAFYLFGKVAASGLNVYDPESFRQIFHSISLPMTVSTDFMNEIVNVGFWYPPISAILFYPLGFMSYQTAYIVWMLVNFLFFGTSIYLIFTRLFCTRRLENLVLILFLFLISTPVKSTIFFSQSNFILLFLLLLMYLNKKKTLGGIALALAVMVKPFMAVFLIYFLLQKDKRVIWSFIISLASLFAITLLILDVESVISFVVNSPAKRLPSYVLTESINQSLLAFLLRNDILAVESFKTSYLYIGTIGILIAASTIISFFLVRKKINHEVWIILLSMAFLIYPATLSHYSMLLLFPIFLFIINSMVRLKTYQSFAYIAIFFIIFSYSAFISIAFIYFTYLTIGIYKLRTNSLTVQSAT